MCLKSIRFGRLLLPWDRPFIIAEAGVNHEGSLDCAMDLVRSAAEAGADAVKFQSYKADRLAARNSPAYWDSSCEATQSQHELFSRFDALDRRDYAKLAAHAAELGIEFMATPFDEYFVEDLDPLLSVYKIASADLTNHPLVSCIASRGKPIILSTGASTFEEVRETVTLIRTQTDAPLALLHCVLSYPCGEADASLNRIRALVESFPEIVIGYSDHVKARADHLPLLQAWLLGARIIEKHFTLDKTLPGNDHYHSMDSGDLRALRGLFAQTAELGGRQVVDVRACEAPARLHARRSIVAARHIRPGEVIDPTMVSMKRPGGGIQPCDIDKVLGGVALRDIPEDTLLDWQMLSGPMNVGDAGL
jgi:sialic acid synthase SpsE